jgi:hypothetical protein
MNRPAPRAKNPSSNRARLVRLTLLLLAGAVLSGVLAPALPAAEPVQPAPTTAAQDDSGDLSSFAVAGIAFGFAMAGTAFAIAVWTGIQSLRRSGRRSGTGAAPTRLRDPAPPAAEAAPAPALVEARQPPARVAARPRPERTCAIELWRGYVKSRYYATAREPGGGERTIAASPFFRPERGVPVEESFAAREAYDTLLEELAELGWAPAEAESPFAFAGRNQST